MDEEHGLTADDLHLNNVDRTLRELQRMVKEQEQTLNQLRTGAGPIQPQRGAQAAKASLDAMASAHRAAAEASPFVPFHGSVLPALLALRKTHETTSQSKAHVASQTAPLDKAQRQLERERARLQDHKALQKALERRIETLRGDLETSQTKSPEQAVRERMAELKQTKKKYDTERGQLMRSLNQFIDDYLGAMLAAEELGGPVVGDLMDIDADELGAGFNTQGKLKKAKADRDGDSRQRRIDDIWGAADGGTPAHRGRDARGDRDEAAAAGAEVRELMELLLNSSSSDSSTAYVEIPRETAAVRFLVRSKVAQFHPKDATRLRLLDFGRDLDE